MDNQTIARQLLRFAERLEREQGNLYRIRAYRRAAEAVQRLEEPVKSIVARDGLAGLRRVAGIGSHLALAIERLATTGEYHTLSDGAEHIAKEERIEQLPGVGPQTAQLLWERLHVQTVDELAEAIHSPQFAALPFGERKRQRLIHAVEERKRSCTLEPAAAEPSVADLLSVDEDFRRQVEGEQLFRVAASDEAGGGGLLPLLSQRRNGWKLLAMYSNTALAHRLGRSRDWVVIYFQKDGHKGQRIVCTERRGSLRGRRVVRGREEECRLYFGANGGQGKEAGLTEPRPSQTVG